MALTAVRPVDADAGGDEHGTTGGSARDAEIVVGPLVPPGAPAELPPGARREVAFEVRAPGPIDLGARFGGAALALILNGPGRLGALERADGPAPLRLRWRASAADLALGTLWRASLVNFSERTARDVELAVRRPRAPAPGRTVVARTLTGAGPEVGAHRNGLAAGAVRELAFEVPCAGTITARAASRPDGPPLALLLDGPGARAPRRRVDGAGALELTWEVGSADLALGTAWRLRLANPGAREARDVRLELEHPARVDLAAAPGRGHILANPVPPPGAPPNSLPAGARRELAFEIPRPGPIEARVTGRGAPLAVILNGPGRLGYVRRVDGAAPLELRYEVRPDDVLRGPGWRLSVANFSGAPARDVAIEVRYPTSAGESADEIAGADVGEV